MKFGVCIPNYGETSSVEGLRTVALEAEKMGFWDSVWTSDHILMPPRNDKPYARIFESITCLAYLAALTTRVKLGVSSLILPMRNPVIAVKQLATIDQFSGGRVMLATSPGWNESEFILLGYNFHDRGARLDESIGIVRKLWSGDLDTEFVGKKIPHEFKNVTFDPRPIQRKLTLWIGGNSKAAMRRAAELGDAWHPDAYPMDLFKELVSEFRSMPGAKKKEICVRIGLNPNAARPEYTDPDGQRRLVLTGSLSENKKTISELERLGVTYVLVASNPDGTVDTADQVESLKILADNLIRK